MFSRLSTLGGILVFKPLLWHNVSTAMKQKKTQVKTSWGHVAEWYHKLLAEGKDTYQKEVILPHLLRLLAIKKGEYIVDLACGQGFFSRALYAHGAHVIGVDAASELIALARQETANISSKAGINALQFEVSAADHLPFIASASVDKVLIVLAIQNIASAHRVFAECTRILKPKGKLYMVLNHPSFRVPQSTSWGWDASHGVQYRRIDRYLSESKIKIQMHPGGNPHATTISFHRPLQYYVKALGKSGLLVNDMEEWISHKKNEPGPKAEAETRARKEIPLFLFLQAVKDGA